jgi:hypothetical protein
MSRHVTFLLPLVGRTDSGRSPEGGGGRKVRARRGTEVFKRVYRRASPSPYSPMVPTPTPTPPRNGEGTDTIHACVFGAAA